MNQQNAIVGGSGFRGIVLGREMGREGQKCHKGRIERQNSYQQTVEEIPLTVYPFVAILISPKGSLVNKSS